ncbi:MAG: class I SAM-dependent methyltransferase [Firmicutes bacterium]|nr:class I SAM-dependent methyltransferase [Bacillota bacterium]
MAWINPDDYSFNTFLMFERFQIRMIFKDSDWHKNANKEEKEKWAQHMGIALNANPVVLWYLQHRCPECAYIMDELAANAPKNVDAEQIREAVNYLLLDSQDFVIYTTPEVMTDSLEWIHGWNKNQLFDLVDLKGKTVLDIGAGTGRLTFAAAEKAAWVYASEPVGTMREFMRNKIKTESIKNVRILDGLVTEIPFPDNTFDVVMSGHVVGDDYDAEVAEMTRVCKNGGWLIDCGGDEDGKEPDAQPEIDENGWENVPCIDRFGKTKYNSRKQVIK